MQIFSNPGQMWAFIMVPFLENEASNIKLCILIKSWTYWAWATKLDFQLPWAWWEASWTALPFSSVELFINALHGKPPHSGAEEVKCMFEPFVVEEDNKSKAIRNPVLNSFCCDSLYSFPQVHHPLQVSGNRQPFLQLGTEGYQLRPACWKAHTVRQEEPKEQASSTRCLNKVLALQELHQLLQLICWQKLPLFRKGSMEDTGHRCIRARWWQADLCWRSSSETRLLREATWKPASWLSNVIKDKIWNASEEGEIRSQVWVA